MKYRFASALLCLALLGAAAATEVVRRDAATGRIYVRARRFRVPYEAVDSGPAGVGAVRLYYTSDEGANWTLYGESQQAKGSFEFVAPDDGAYGFTVQAIDKAGHEERKEELLSGAAPEISVVVDTKAPQILPVFPRQDVELAPGAHMRVRFRADDPNLLSSTARISVRKEDETRWTALEDVTATDGEFFATGDILFAGTYSVRLEIADRAGNAAAKTFTFICTKTPKPPVRPPGQVGRNWVVPISAPPRAKSLIFDIDYRVADIAGHPPAAVALWYTTDSGATWQFYGLDADVEPPCRFQAPREGVYGFKLTATTAAGVSEEPPKAGTKPDIITVVDGTHPTLMLDEPRGGESYAGGKVHYIRWTARDDYFGSLPISIHLSREGGVWELLAADLPNNGVYGWNVPLIDFATYRLRIEARDQVGNNTMVISDAFYVASAPPETRITGVLPAVEAVGVSEWTGPPEAARPETPDNVQPMPPTPPPTGVGEAEMNDLIEKATGARLRGEWEAAEKTLREAAERDRRSVRARNELGALLTDQGRYVEAIEILKDARALAPTDADVLYNMAVAYYLLGQYGDSVAAFETLLQDDPANEPVIWNLAKAHWAAGEVESARRSWQRLVTLNVPGSTFAARARKALSSVAQPAR